MNNVRFTKILLIALLGFCGLQSCDSTESPTDNNPSDSILTMRIPNVGSQYIYQIKWYDTTGKELVNLVRFDTFTVTAKDVPLNEFSDGVKFIGSKRGSLKDSLQFRYENNDLFIYEIPESSYTHGDWMQLPVASNQEKNFILEDTFYTVGSKQYAVKKSRHYSNQGQEDFTLPNGEKLRAVRISSRYYRLSEPSKPMTDSGYYLIVPSIGAYAKQRIRYFDAVRENTLISYTVK